MTPGEPVAEPTPSRLATLYEADETAWLDEMSALAEAGRVAELDHQNLAEYLASMAKRDRREVENRLTVLIAHFLKWHHQEEKRSSSWVRTIDDQQIRLSRLTRSGSLRKHAEESIAEVYRDAVKSVAKETRLKRDQFPQACPFTLDQLLTDDLSLDDD